MKYVVIAIILFIVGLISCVKVSAQETALTWPDNMPRPVLRFDCGKTEGAIHVKVQLGRYISNTFVVDCMPA